jgi:hypothetical protein
MGSKSDIPVPQSISQLDTEENMVVVGRWLENSLEGLAAHDKLVITTGDRMATTKVSFK